MSRSGLADVPQLVKVIISLILNLYRDYGLGDQGLTFLYATTPKLFATTCSAYVKNAWKLTSMLFYVSMALSLIS
jgi:hypothetical protein